MDLLLIGIVLFLAVMAIKFSSKSGVPALLLFIVLGMVFSSLGFEFDNFAFADQFATLALMVIMFQGGFSTNWKMAKPVARESIVLSFFGVIFTALITGVFCHYVFKFDFIEAMLIGSIVGSTDFASVSNILRSQNLNLKYNSAPLLELESGSNDPTAYTMTMVFLSILIGKKISIPVMILSQILIGTASGFLIAFVFMKLLRFLSFDEDGLFIIFIVAAALFTFSFTNFLTGNGYLAVYIFGIYVGNQQFKGKRDAVFFLDGFSNLMQIGLFFMLGLLSNLDKFIENMPVAAIIMIFMMIVSRPVSVYLLMLPFDLERNQLQAISLAGIRGAAAIAFAIMVVNSEANLNGDLYHIVFGICVLSSLAQGSLMAPLSKRWQMIDPNDTVLKTFNDYQDKSELGFIQTQILSGSRWINKPLSSLNMAFNVIIAKIERDGKTLVPKGSTILKENDIIVLGGESHFDPTGHNLVEFTIPENHKWDSKLVKDLDLADNELIIMLQRTGVGIIVPDGNTQILAGDKLVTIRADE